MHCQRKALKSTRTSAAFIQQLNHTPGSQRQGSQTPCVITQEVLKAWKFQLSRLCVILSHDMACHVGTCAGAQISTQLAMAAAMTEPTAATCIMLPSICLESEPGRTWTWET
jgi:hypothetical protein